MNELKKKEKLMPAFDNLDSSVKTWWQNFRKIMEIYLLALYFSAIPILILFSLSFLSAKDIIPIWLTIFLTILSFFVIAYFFIKAYISIILLLKNNFEANKKTLFKEADNYIAPYIGLSLLVGILILLWALLLIIPAIIFSVFYSMVYMVLFFEDIKGMKAIKRSKELVKGYFWPVLGRILLINLVLAVFLLVIYAPINYFPEESFGFMVYDFIYQLLAFLIAPISLFFTYNIYKDLKRVKS